MTAAEKIANNPMLTALARVGMFLTSIIVPIALFILGNYLSTQAAAMQSFSDRMTATERFAGDLDKRLAVLEQAILTTRSTSSETLVRIERMQDSLITLSNSVAALGATIRSQDR